MAKPIAIAGASPAPIAYASNPTVVILNGSGTPGTGGTSIVGYTWVVLDEPDAVIFDDVNIYNPTVSNLPTEGTVLLFLKVTDNLGAVSEEDPLQAPDSAFYRISIKSQNIDIEKPAAGQRNWEPAYTDAVDKIDNFKAEFDAHTIASHDTTATGAQLTTLTNGSNADSLHTHSASAFSTLAAIGTAGKVELASAPLDAGHPKALTQEHVTFSGTFSGVVDVAAGTPSHAQIAFYNPYTAFRLQSLAITLRDGGGAGGPAWEFKVYTVSLAKYKANTFSGAGVTLIDTIAVTLPGSDNQPTGVAGAYADTPTFDGGTFIIVTCTGAPTPSGADLGVTITGTVRY